MKLKLRQNKVIVKRSRLHGYGVFAGKNFKKGEVIEDCYFILSKGGDDGIEDFYFDVRGRYAVFLGYGSIYNHSDDPNADYFINVKDRVTTFKADRPIKKGEEISISYGDDWFSLRGKKPRHHAKPGKAKNKKKKR